MAQEIREGTEATAFTYGRHVWQEDVTLGSSYESILLIDARKITQSVIQFYNLGDESLSYKIFATAKYDPSLLKTGIKDPTVVDPNNSNGQWINLLSIIAGQTGTNYDHTTSKVVASTKRFYESFTNEWFAVLVQCVSPNGTDLSIWHRGQS